MKKKFLKIVERFFGGFFGVISLIIGFFWWRFSDPMTNIPLWCLFVAFFLFYLIIILLYSLAKEPKVTIYKNPAVKNIHMDDNEPTFIVEPNDLYGQGAGVSIFFQEKEDDIEIFLGIGYVETINNNKFLQIIFLDKSQKPNAVSIIEKIGQCNPNKIIIKPFINCDTMC